jgi:hypothetical protein
MSRRSLKEFSFGYSVPPGGQRRAKDGTNELIELELVEVGPTLKRMNPATDLHSVKGDTAPDPDQLYEPELEDIKERVRREMYALLSGSDQNQTPLGAARTGAPTAGGPHPPTEIACRPRAAPPVRPHEARGGARLGHRPDQQVTG